MARDRPTADAREPSVPRAPSYEDVPAAKARTARGGPTVHEIAVRIEVVTPILGGGSRTAGDLVRS